MFSRYRHLLQNKSFSVCHRKLRYLKPHYEFRSGYIYSNLMYGLMTHMTEEMTGRPWNDLIRERIFRPVGMDSSSFTDEITPKGHDIAQPYMKTTDGSWRPVDFDFHRWALISWPRCRSNARSASHCLSFEQKLVTSKYDCELEGVSKFTS